MARDSSSTTSCFNAARLGSSVTDAILKRSATAKNCASPMYVTIKNTTIQGGEFGLYTAENGTAAPVTAYSHVSLDHVTIQGATESGVWTGNGNLDISNSNITENVGNSAAGIMAEDYATLNVQSTMITSNTVGVCIYTNSTAIIGTSTVIADNTTNNEACGGVVQGIAGVGPSPKL